VVAHADWALVRRELFPPKREVTGAEPFHARAGRLGVLVLETDRDQPARGVPSRCAGEGIRQLEDGKKRPDRGESGCPSHKPGVAEIGGDGYVKRGGAGGKIFRGQRGRGPPSQEEMRGRRRTPAALREAQIENFLRLLWRSVSRVIRGLMGGLIRFSFVP